MLKEKEIILRRATVILDGIVISGAFLLSHFLRQHFYKLYDLQFLPSPKIIVATVAPLGYYSVILLFVVPFWCLMLYLNGMYKSMRTRKLSSIVWIIVKSSFFACLAFGAVVFMFKREFVSRIFFVVFITLGFLFILGEKLFIYSFMHKVRRRGYNFRRLLIVGTGRRAANFIERIQDHPEWGMKILGAIEDEPGRGISLVQGVRVIGILRDIPNILHRLAIDEVVFVVPRLRLTHIEDSIQECEIHGVKATIAVDLFDLKIARSYPSELDGIPLLTFETTVAREWQLFVKRAMDIVLSGMGIIVTSPLLLITSILIKLTYSGTDIV